MNFAAFQTWREECLRTVPNVLDCAEVNLYRALAPLQPRPALPDTDQRIHRCDLARAWLGRYGFDARLSRHALICRGVRHALSLIFRRLAADGANLWIPEDVYPVYQVLARAAGIEPRTFVTLPEPEIPSVRPGTGAEYLLVANPWKPLGRYLNRGECDLLIEWVDASPRRYVLLDCVYDLGNPLHPATMQLQQTGRAILLHSVTKGWLWPETFGVAHVGEGCASFESDFRDEPPSVMQLRQAQYFLSTEAGCPARVGDALERRLLRFMTSVPAAVTSRLLVDSAQRARGSYLFPVPIDARQMLEQYRLLAIPASAFGSSNWNGSILTSLSGAFDPQ